MNNPRTDKSGFVSFSKASKLDDDVEETTKYKLRSLAFAPKIDQYSQLETFPTEATKFRIKPKKLHEDLDKDDAIEKYTDKSSMLYVYHKMRKENPSLIDLMSLGQDEMDEPLPTG